MTIFTGFGMKKVQHYRAGMIASMFGSVSNNSQDKKAGSFLFRDKSTTLDLQVDVQYVCFPLLSPCVPRQLLMKHTQTHL